MCKRIYRRRMGRTVWGAVSGIVGSFIIPLTGWAQVTEDQDTREQEIEIEFSVYTSHPRLAQGIFYVEDSGKQVPLDFRANRRSRPIRYRGNRNIWFYSPALRTGSSAQAEASIPDTMERPLLLFLPNPPGAVFAWRVYPLEDGLSQFPYGTWRLLNLSGVKLRLGWGEYQQTMQGGITLPVRQGNSPLPRRLEVFREDGRISYNVFGSSLVVRENERLLVVILPPRTDNAAELPVQILREYR